MWNGWTHLNHWRGARRQVFPSSKVWSLGKGNIKSWALGVDQRWHSSCLRTNNRLYYPAVSYWVKTLYTGSYEHAWRCPTLKETLIMVIAMLRQSLIMSRGHNSTPPNTTPRAAKPSYISCLGVTYMEQSVSKQGSVWWKMPLLSAHVAVFSSFLPTNYLAAKWWCLTRWARQAWTSMPHQLCPGCGQGQHGREIKESQAWKEWW
jgi:hypothetical protein